MGEANALRSSPAPPVQRAPPTCLSCSPLDLLPMPPGPMWPGEGGPWRAGHQPGSELSRLPVPEWAVRSPSAPLSLLPEGPAHLPLLISPASGAPILSGLHFSSPLSTPTSYQFTWGFLPSPWVSGSPTEASRHPNCGETLKQCLPTLPS